MSIYAYADALHQFAFLLDEAFKHGEVRIQRDDGQVFIITSDRQPDSPLDVEGIHLGITTQEILECIHEGRKLN